MNISENAHEYIPHSYPLKGAVMYLFFLQDMCGNLFLYGAQFSWEVWVSLSLAVWCSLARESYAVLAHFLI